jgi:hypothetical protein
MTRPRHTAAAFQPLRSRFLAMFALLAFTFQGLAVQTHIHGAPPGGVHLVQASVPVTSDPRDPLDPATCPLCQELAHAGAVITPVPPLVALLLEWTAISFLAPQKPTTASPPPTGWQSRAPPRS